VEVTIDSLSSVQHKLLVTVPPNELQPHFDAAYAKSAAKIELRGFRKGKAPLAMIKKMYGEQIEFQSLDDIANFYYKQIVKEKKFRPVGEPILDDVHYHPGGELKFTIKVETLPEITLQELKGLPVVKVIHNVSDDEVEHELEYIRRVNSTLTEVQQATDNEHLVTVEIQELDDKGLPIIGHKTDAIQVLLSDETKLPEIREGLKSAEAGKKYHITYSPQQGERIEPVDGEFTVLKVQKVNLPDLNEEFIKKITKDKVSSLSDFRTNVYNDLQTYWNDKTMRSLEDAIANEVVRIHPFDVPDSLVNGFADGLVADVKEKQPGKTLPPNFDEKQFREENREYCVWQAKWFLLREKIRLQLNLKIEDADYDGLAEVESKKISIEKDRLIAYYKNSSQINEKILNDKMFSFLITNAKITEKVDSEMEESKLITA